jgi:hypothetical protein
MTSFLLITAALVAFSVSAAAQQTTFRDSRGSTIGTATRDSQGTTVFRDARGSTTGTATTSGNQTTYRNSRGSTTGTSTRPR